MKPLLRFSIWIMPAAFVFAAVPVQANGGEIRLTDASVSNCNGFWDTKAGPDWADVLFYTVSDGTTNYLNGRERQYATTNLSVPLIEGTNLLKFLAQGGDFCGMPSPFQLNLVFERRPLPDISAEGAVDILGNLHPIHANLHPVTPFMEGSVISAKKLVYTNRLHSYRITLVSAQFSPFADGYAGECTLVMEPIREQLRIRTSEVELSFESISNKTYQLFYRTLLNTNVWQPLNQPFIGTGQRIYINDTVPESELHRFYRLEKIEDGGNP
jgi:hypothetical protein